MRFIFCLSIFLFANTFCFTQEWKSLQVETTPLKGQRDFFPKKFKLFNINNEALRVKLWQAELDTDVLKAKQGKLYDNAKTFIDVPTADGVLHTFAIVEYKMMEQGLQDKFPFIKTFYGVDKDQNRIFIDYTLYGFRAIIYEGFSKKTFIDYFSREDMNSRIVYYKKDYTAKKDFSCNVLHELDVERKSSVGNRAGDTISRTYRLAVAATGEYTTFHGGTVALALSAITTSVNRVNSVYMLDFSTQLLLVATNNLIIYTNSSTDPYTNNDGVAMLAQNQTNCDNVIGSANYDLGHVFSTGGGGVASLGVPCTNSSKARGVTGSGSPIGDPFDIDYVAHEMGHQFGANHTFNNSNTGACAGNQNTATAVEPGSGSTIMAYAGICGAVDIQPNSDDYMHGVSLTEIASEISTNTCDVQTASGNSKPVITGLPNYTIPISTPFVLTAIATDPNGDPMEYCWEQTDAATATGLPSSTSTNQAIFRSISPTTNTRRYFPKIADIVNNTTTVWEVLPTVSRNINFRLTVRDIHGVIGTTSEDAVLVNSVSTAGPFVVNVLNSGSNTLLEGQTFSVLWSVANTNVAPVNAANVDIFLSYDGGLTYPVTLASAVPNDGAHDVVIPTGLSTTARIMVRGSGNIFFDINNINFTINSGAPTFFIAINPNSLSLCNDQSAVINVTSSSLGGYSTPFNLSTTNLPPGAVATFVPSTLTPGQSSTLTINNFGSNTGTFNVTVTGSNADATRTQNLALTLSAATSIPVPNLVSPADATVNQIDNVILSWSNGTKFEYQISTSNTFSSIVATSIVTQTSDTIFPGLSSSTLYYWRVRGVNDCGVSNWSVTRSFTTAVCLLYTSTNVPIVISASGTPTINSNLPITDKGNVVDIDVINLEGTHTWISDLRFTLLSPQATGNSRIIINSPCDDEDDFDINLDDYAASATLPCPLTTGLPYKPANTLSFFVNQSIKGNWRMRVQDLFNTDGGSLNAWSMKVCASNFCRLEVQNNNQNGIGSLFEAVSCAAAGDTIKFASSLNNTTLNLGTQTLAINKNLTFLSTAGNNISIASNSITAPTLSVTGAFNVKIIGLKIIGSQNPVTSGVQNQGTLILNNSQVLKNPSVISSQVVNNVSGGTLNLEGSCRVD